MLISKFYFIHVHYELLPEHIWMWYLLRKMFPTHYSLYYMIIVYMP